MTRIVFIIPAKCESIRAPGKNLALFERTLIAALRSCKCAT